VLFLLVPAAYLDAADMTKVRRRTLQDVPRLVADRISSSANIGTVYVFNYEPIIYYLADAPPPTRYVLLPADITACKLADEVRRIMRSRPSYIVVTDSPVFAPPPPKSRTLSKTNWPTTMCWITNSSTASRRSTYVFTVRGNRL
jgi:hypothetical protein